MKKATKCLNCGKHFTQGEQYCVYCGTKTQEMPFYPELDFGAEVYGPPPDIYILTCKKCGKRWESHEFGINRTKYCPDCGSEAYRTHVLY
ncbi:MAG: zinc ribbon domain-containing protein [Oscillospiraceae bacterium]|nr:zinc ribbon domain-containing protein [Oscillospiraceae bacterium]